MTGRAAAAIEFLRLGDVAVAAPAACNSFELQKMLEAARAADHRVIEIVGGLAAGHTATLRTRVSESVHGTLIAISIAANGDLTDTAERYELGYRAITLLSGVWRSLSASPFELGDISSRTSSAGQVVDIRTLASLPGGVGVSFHLTNYSKLSPVLKVTTDAGVVPFPLEEVWGSNPTPLRRQDRDELVEVIGAADSWRASLQLDLR